MRKFNLVMLGVAGALLANMTMADSLIDVRPVVSVNNPINIISTTVSNSLFQSIAWTVTNNTSSTLTNLGVNATYHTTGEASGITTDLGDCTGDLGVGDTCRFTTLIQGSVQPDTFQITPQVCAFNGQLCSTPNETDNKLNVGVGPYVYIPVESTHNFVSFNGTGLEVGTKVPGLAFEYVQGVAVSPNGSRVYTVEDGVGDQQSQQNFLVLSSGPAPTVLARIPMPLAGDLEGVAVSPDDSTIYIGDYANNQLYVVDHNTDTDTYTLVTSDPISPYNIAVGNAPEDIVFSSDGDNAYVANSGNGLSDNASISVIDPTNSDNNFTIDNTTSNCNFDGPMNLAITSDNNTVFVANNGEDPSTISIVHPNIGDEPSCDAAIELSGYSQTVALDSTDNYIYSVGIDDDTQETTVWVVHGGTTYAFTEPSIIGDGNYAIALSPDNNTLYVATATKHYVYAIALSNGYPTDALPSVADVGGTSEILGNKFVGIGEGFAP